MQVRKWTLEGYKFPSFEQFEKAKKEREAIDYIKTNADLTNFKTAYQVYQKLISKGTLHTELGVDFLNDIRSQLLSSNYVKEDELSPLPTINKETEELSIKNVSNKESAITKSKYQNPTDKNTAIYNQLIRLRIINIFLVIIIIAMFVIALTSKNSPYVDQEKRVLDKYSAWSEELTLKQKELLEKESQLNQIEAELKQKGILIPKTNPVED